MMTRPLVTTVELPGIPRVRSGKVREVFDAGEHYLIVATDRISAFDCVLPGGIPGKGAVLNQLSTWWFERLTGIIPNHLVSTNVRDYPANVKPYHDVLRGRSMLVRKTTVFPVECVARGYLAGSGWKEYQASGSVCGVPLPPGLRLADRLPEPIFTPATKAETGHDENISLAAMADAIGGDIAAVLRKTTLDLYNEASGLAAGCGLILADTKFEFGRADDGKIILIDEALTPDSSRYWPAADVIPGTNPPSFDKQFVRDYLASLNWNKMPPAPALPAEIARQTSEKYVEAYTLLTGQAFSDA